jgi:hypothetical protein
MSQWMEVVLMDPNNWFLFLFLMFLKIIDATRRVFELPLFLLSSEYAGAMSADLIAFQMLSPSNTAYRRCTD